MPSLRALLESPIEVAAAVTRPDRPAGRGLERRASAVKVAASAAGIELLQPERAGDPELHHRIKTLELDAAVVVAYGKILPLALLEIPPLGFVNVHFSLLPAYRGASPVQRALMDGVAETGVSLIVLTEGMDEGPVLAAERVAVTDDDTSGTLGPRLAEVGAALLVPTLERYAAGAIRPVEQDHAAATYAPRIDPGETRIRWDEPGARIKNLVRALNPEPGAWTTFRGSRVKVWRAAPAPGRALHPGELEAAGDLFIGTGNGALALTEVQLAGRRRMGGDELARGLRLEPGQRLE